MTGNFSFLRMYNVFQKKSKWKLHIMYTANIFCKNLFPLQVEIKKKCS